MLKWFGNVKRMGEERLVKRVYQANVKMQDHLCFSQEKGHNTSAGENWFKDEIVHQEHERGSKQW